MGNLPKWVIYLSLSLLVMLGVIFWFFSPKKTSGIISENQPRLEASPTPGSIVYPSDKLPKLTSNSREITGVLEEGCVPENLSITANGIKYQFKSVDSIKTNFIGTEVIADISPDVSKDNCGTTVKLGSIRETDNPSRINVLGKIICFPPVNTIYESDCWVGIQSQAGDYYTVDSVPVYFGSSTSKLDLILVSGTIDNISTQTYPGQKARIIIATTELLVKDEYK